MSFAAKLRSTSEATMTYLNASSEERAKMEKEKMEKIKHEKFVFLTEKYHALILRGVESAASNGKREKFMNFAREDFKANHPGLGYPRDFQSMWLSEMTNPQSSYLPQNDMTGEKLHFEGLEFDIWNNGAFTTVFTW